MHYPLFALPLQNLTHSLLQPTSWVYECRDASSVPHEGIMRACSSFLRGTNHQIKAGGMAGGGGGVPAPEKVVAVHGENCTVLIVVWPRGWSPVQSCGTKRCTNTVGQPNAIHPKKKMQRPSLQYLLQCAVVLCLSNKCDQLLPLLVS